jgi:MoxR-like ATPase
MSNYIMRRNEELALKWALGHTSSGAACLLLEGPPGCGKSAFAEHISKTLDAPLIPHQMHAWSDADELFVGVDVVAAVAGDVPNVRQQGVLALAATQSQQGRVVVLLDEIDKASERTEALLLDWLQSGRVPVQPGKHLMTNQRNLIVVLTSNAQRDLSDALLRRCRRVRMDPLEERVQLELLIELCPKVPKGVVKLGQRAATTLAERSASDVSLQEIQNFLNEVLEAETAEDIRLALSGWVARNPRGHQLAMIHDVAPIMAEIKASRSLRPNR